MNWIKDIIPNIKRNLSQTFGDDKQSKVPEGLWKSCDVCGSILYIPELKKSSYVCSKCGNHFKIDVNERVEVTFDEGTNNVKGTTFTVQFYCIDNEMIKWVKEIGHQILLQKLHRKFTQHWVAFASKLEFIKSY